MAIKVKVFLYEGSVESILTDTEEKVEVEFIDAYSKSDYGDFGTSSDEAAAEGYEEECRANGFHDVSSFEIVAHKDPEEDEEDNEDDEDYL